MDTRETEAAKAAGDALEQALLKAAQSVERELARIVKTGEDDLDLAAQDPALGIPLGHGQGGSPLEVLAHLALVPRHGAADGDPDRGLLGRGGPGGEEQGKEQGDAGSSHGILLRSAGIVA